MKRIIGFVLALIASATLLVAPPASATPDLAVGRTVFNSNCAACHRGGMNTVNAQKTLQKADLEKYGMNSADAIMTQVTNGKGGMPAFGGRLTPNQIESVAAYVLAQSDAGWS